MTIEEAILWLINPTITSTEISATKAKELEAYDMAIEALSAVCDDCIWHVCNYNKVDWGAPSAEAVQVTGKLKNPCDSSLTADSDECKEQKSKLDLISRQDVLTALLESGLCHDIWVEVRNEINAIPSAEVVHKPDYSYEADMVRRLRESDLVYRPSADDTFCKSQLITCNRVKECNGVCPFEDALKHADQMQTMNEQHVIDHDRDWIIGCIQHDGFIHTHRFDKANQIILEAVQGEECDHCVYKCGMKGGDDE